MAYYILIDRKIGCKRETCHLCDFQIYWPTEKNNYYCQIFKKQLISNPDKTDTKRLKKCIAAQLTED